MPLDNLIQTTLDNGLQVILRPSQRAPVASFWIFYRVGSRNETPGHTGISHWVEHMLFMGTERYPRGEFDKAVARAGGVFNGMTGPDWTVYFETLPAERIELALQVESDRMAHASFAPEETESERTVILSEREGSENSYFYRLHEEVQAAAYHVHSYRNPIIGWPADLLALTREELYAHYRTYYTANNAVAVVTGDFAPDVMLTQIARYFGDLPSGPPPPPVRIQEPPMHAERRVVLRGDDPTAYYLHAFQAPPALHPDFFPFVVLDSVLGGAKGMGLFGGGANNRSNRLYRALVERELTVDVNSSFGPTIDPGLFTISATLAPDIEHRQVEAAIWQEIATVQREGVAPAELARAIKQTRAQFAYSSESVTYEAFWLGFSQVVASLDWLATWDEQLQAVTPADVQRMAQTYLTPDRQTVGYYVPTLADDASPVVRDLSRDLSTVATPAHKEIA
ncbi:MAG TPA: insulinase family protein [Chloroflexi bacterium]|nr:insulinase family protein [Chloroflexota bacterium]